MFKDETPREHSRKYFSLMPASHLSCLSLIRLFVCVHPHRQMHLHLNRHEHHTDMSMNKHKYIHTDTPQIHTYMSVCLCGYQAISSCVKETCTSRSLVPTQMTILIDVLVISVFMCKEKGEGRRREKEKNQIEHNFQ